MPNIPGPVDLARLTCPPGICQPCHATWRATRPRPMLCYCWHNAVVARQRRDGSWRTLDHVTAEELKTLQTNEVSK